MTASIPAVLSKRTASVALHQTHPLPRIFSVSHAWNRLHKGSKTQERVQKGDDRGQCRSGDLVSEVAGNTPAAVYRGRGIPGYLDNRIRAYIPQPLGRPTYTLAGATVLWRNP